MQGTARGRASTDRRELCWASLGRLKQALASASVVIACFAAAWPGHVQEHDTKKPLATDFSP